MSAWMIRCDAGVTDLTAWSGGEVGQHCGGRGTEAGRRKQV